MGRLIAHKDTSRVEEHAVKAIPPPPFTETWHPVSHASVIDSAYAALNKVGLRVRDAAYSLSKNGGNMFGVMQLDQGDASKSWALGIRNSTQKHFAVGLCAGNKVLVCDNLAFQGDFVEFRKHTSGLTLEQLQELALRGVLAMVQKLKEFDTWFENLRQVDVIEAEFKTLTYDAMASGVLVPSKFNEFLLAWDEEKKVNVSSGTLLDFHGASTRVFRGDSMFTVQQRSANLIPLCDQFVARQQGHQTQVLLAGTMKGMAPSS